MKKVPTDKSPEDQVPTDPVAEKAVSPPKQRAPLTWKMRIALVTFGTVVGLVILEISLRSFGLVYYHEQQHMPVNHPEDAFVIMCIGDSCTYGQGGGRNTAETKQHSYPMQLQHILNKRHPEGKYRVVNMGFPGANSSQVVRRYEGWLRLHEPDLCIILIGNNDVWNQNESYLHLVGKGKRTKFSRRLRTRLRVWGDSLAVVRLVRCIAVSIHDKRDKAPTGSKDDDDEWNPDEDTTPNNHNFKKGREILGEIELIEELYRMNFKRISKIAEDHGTKILWLDYHLPAKFGETDYIDPVLEDLGAPYMDLGPIFTEDGKSRPELIAGDKWHPNHLGYALFARAVYNKLTELGYAPGPPLENIQDNIAPHK